MGVVYEAENTRLGAGRPSGTHLEPNRSLPEGTAGVGGSRLSVERLSRYRNRPQPNRGLRWAMVMPASAQEALALRSGGADRKPAPHGRREAEGGARSRLPRLLWGGCGAVIVEGRDRPHSKPSTSMMSICGSERAYSTHRQSGELARPHSSGISIPSSGIVRRVAKS